MAGEIGDLSLVQSEAFDLQDRQQADDPLFPRTSDRLKALNMDKDELRALRSFLDTL